MEAALLGTNQKSDCLMMLRRFGYGVPDKSRALRSASNSVGLLAQQEIQPVVRPKGEQAHLNKAHFYALPWPTNTLLELGAHEVRLRVTLSATTDRRPSSFGSPRRRGRAFRP